MTVHPRMGGLRLPEGRFVCWTRGGMGTVILIDALHAASPQADAYTGPIVEAAARALSAHCIIAAVSRTEVDLNRPRDSSNAAAIDEYRAVIRGLLEGTELLEPPDHRLRKPFLHLAVHGMDDGHGYDVEVGTRRGDSCSGMVRTLVRDVLRSWAGESWTPREPKVVLDHTFVGDRSKVVHRLGEPESSYDGYGSNFNTVQIEFASWLRRSQRARVVDALIRIGNAFQGHT